MLLGMQEKAISYPMERTPIRTPSLLPPGQCQALPGSTITMLVVGVAGVVRSVPSNPGRLDFIFKLPVAFLATQGDCCGEGAF